ncbi:MAG: endonuclease [Flavobacteriales bacterium]
MKKLFLLLMVASLMGCTKSDKEGKESKEKKGREKDFNVELFPVKEKADAERMAFYNVENLFDTKNNPDTDDDEYMPKGEKEWDDKRYNKKLKHIGKVLRTIGGDGFPSLVGLCEVENEKVVRDLIKRNCDSANNYKIVHKQSPDGRGIDVALIYKKNSFKLLSKAFHKVDLPGDVRPTRDILYAELGYATKVDTLHVFVNHWPSRYGGKEKTEPKRVAAAKTLKEKVDSLHNNKNSPNIIITGDFNDHPDNKSIEEVLHAEDELDDSDEKLLNLLAKAHEKDNKGTYNYKGEWGVLDQFIVSRSLLESKSGGFYVKTKDAHILKEKWMLYIDKEEKMVTPNRTYGGPEYYGGYSDHLPIYLDLRTKVNPQR